MSNDPRLKVYETLHELKNAAPNYFRAALDALGKWQDAEILTVVRASPERVLINQGRAQMALELVEAFMACSDRAKSIMEKRNGQSPGKLTAV